MIYQAMTQIKQAIPQLELPYEELFHIMLDNLPVAIALLDSQLRYVKVSQRWLNEYGFSEPDIIGKFHHEVFPGLSEHWKQLYQKCTDGSIQTWEEYLPQDDSGAIQRIKWEAHPWVLQKNDSRNQITRRKTHYRKPQIAGLILFSEKIVTCSLHPEISQRQIERENIIRSIAVKIHQSLTLSEILQNTVNEVRQFLNTDRVVIYRFNSDWNGSIAVESVASGWMQLIGKSVQDICFIEKYIKLYQQGRTRVISNIETSGLMPCHVRFLKQFQVKAKLVVPILQDDRIWGLLIVHECKATRIWQEVDINLLKQLTTHVGIAIQKHQAEAEIHKAKQELEIRVKQRTSELSCVVEQLENVILERKKVEECLRTVITNTPIVLYALDSQGVYTFLDGKGLENLGKKPGEDVGLSVFAVYKGREDILNPIRRVLLGEEVIWTTKFGEAIYENRANPLNDENGKIIGLIGIAIDITYRVKAEEAIQQKAQELEQSLHKLRTTQTQLIQTEKISSLGQLVAGVAHEVNNPVAFISGNLHIAYHYASDLLTHLQLYQNNYPNNSEEIEYHAENIDLKFIKEDLLKMLSSMILGTNRIREIMQSLRNFSRLDQADAKPVDIHEGLDSTLMILQHRLKKQPKHPGIQVIKEYGKLPLVECYASQLNQVFMNLLANAIDAFDEYNCDRTYQEIETNPNVLRITTELVDNSHIAVRIADNGPGIPEEVIPKLFEPFFTTKPVGKGTGLGLSISHQIVTEIHKGKLNCISEPGKGTEFIIKIPIQREANC